MNTKSNGGDNEFKVSVAGANRRSILPPAGCRAQCFCAIAVNSSLTSQVINSPSSGNADAIMSALYPTNVPISKTRLAPPIVTSVLRKYPTVLPDIIPAAPVDSTSTAMSLKTLSGVVVCATVYSSIPSGKSSILG